MKAVNMIIDVARCFNCNNCFLADKDEHVDNDWLPYSLAQPRHGHRWIDILRKDRGQCPMVDVAYLPTMCNQCRRPPCIKSGPAGAVYQRSDGIVIIDPIKSRGYKEIVQACPYGHIWWNEEKQVPQKWTMNAHLLDSGWKEPRCVQTCATGAMLYLKADEDEMQRLIGVEKLEVLHPEWNTGPRVYYKNLYRFTHAFIGGSLAINKNGMEECAADAKVSLFIENEKIVETVTDNYGDFKIDRLKENSGQYRIMIECPGKERKTISVELGSSLYLGTIVL